MNCVICGRHLTNPVSILAEMGPICRQRDQLQEVFDFMHAEFEMVKRGDDFIFIRDIGKVCRSVTNDAEWVVRQLYYQYQIDDSTRIFYEDSEGQIDELDHMGINFVGFKAGRKGVDLCI